MIALPGYLQADLPRVRFRQLVLESVRDYQLLHGGISPPQKVIAEDVGNRSVSAVQRALKLLEHEGYIRRHRTQIMIVGEDGVEGR